MILLFGFTFEINLFSIIAFLAGMFAGAVLLGLFYIFSCLISLRRKSVRIRKEICDISEADVRQIIQRYQEDFEDERKRRKGIPGDYFRTTIFAMMNEIAGKFYPKSKRPLLELSVNEMILLDRYIISKVEELLSHKGLTVLRSLKISTILRLMETKSAVDHNAVVRTAKRYRLKQITTVVSGALNLLNPYFWFKKLVINPSVRILMNKICLICFSIVGEETYKIYSKQALAEMDENLKELLDSLWKAEEDAAAPPSEDEPALPSLPKS